MSLNRICGGPIPLFVLFPPFHYMKDLHTWMVVCIMHLCISEGKNLMTHSYASLFSWIWHEYAILAIQDVEHVSLNSFVYFRKGDQAGFLCFLWVCASIMAITNREGSTIWASHTYTKPTLQTFQGWSLIILLVSVNSEIERWDFQSNCLADACAEVLQGPWYLCFCQDNS